MIYQFTMLDLSCDEPRIADVTADGEVSAFVAVRRLYPASTFAVLFAHKIGNEDAVSRHPLRARSPRQVELSL